MCEACVYDTALWFAKRPKNVGHKIKGDKVIKGFFFLSQKFW